MMSSKPELKSRSDVHLARKIWHFSGVLFIAYCYHNLSRSHALQILTAVCALGIFIDVYRQRSATVNKWVQKLASPIMRENERASIAGTTYLLIGVLAIVALFPYSVVMLSLLFLAIADPTASYFGIRYGRDRLVGKKTLQGSMAAFFACTIISAVYFYTQNIMTERLLIVSLVSGFIGAVSEIIPVGDLDDNLVLPVVSSCLLYVLYFLFGGF